MIFTFPLTKKKQDEYPPLTIVIADDDEDDRQLFSEALDELKLKTSVYTVKDGVELMDYLSKEETPMPYLLFLDLNMPRKNGLQCLKEIRQSERLKEIVVTIYSTSSSEKDIEETFQSGANGYLKKPNNFGMLKKALHKIVMYAHVYRDPPFNKANFLFKV